ncbi:MAG TPA: hypothetical protein VL119_15210 [Acidimicrobiia bacterium]|nr:hypothetical protein [Acidimicrobiia bacterium]
MARADLLDLEPGEELLAAARASFRGAAASSVGATFALGSARMRMRAFDAWHDAAIGAGFPFVPPDMVIAASDRRLLFGKPTFLGRTPSRFWSELDYAKVAQIVAVRHGLLTGVAFAFNHGAVIEVEAVRGRRLRQLVAVIDAHLPRT